MQTGGNLAYADWGFHINRTTWIPGRYCPDWMNVRQRDRWNEKGLIIWDRATQTVACLRGGQALDPLVCWRANDAWQQQGFVVGEPCWRIVVDDPDHKGEQSLLNEIALDPQQTATLFEALMQEEAALQAMAAEEKEAAMCALTQVYELLLREGERGKHTVYDENLSWEENKRLMHARWESRALPEKLTWTERRLFGAVLTEIDEERRRKKLRAQERAHCVRWNLTHHRFFWQRIQGIWPSLEPAERLHILRRLQEETWNDSALAEVRQLIENARFFAGLHAQSGDVQAPQLVTPEELNLILGLSDEDLWNQLIALYPRGESVS